MKRILCIGTTLALLGLSGTVAAENPYFADDGSWVSLSGKAVETTEDGFTLDYGVGTVTVEMDDWDWYEESGEVLEGDRVTVYGEVDDETYEGTKIEASSVYVENLGTYFYASAADEESMNRLDLSPAHPVEIGTLSITGTISSVSGTEFTLDTGAQAFHVDTAMLDYNPMDKIGYQKLESGDVVTVTGYLEDDTFEKQEMMADSVITLNDDSA